jgi:poly-gamma-glutamate capsule biosynthesis protein CapA/YwtB (metallophosphatase superfamily)
MRRAGIRPRWRYALMVLLAGVPLLVQTAAAGNDFVLVAVGDMVISRPLSMLQNRGALDDPRPFADTLALLRHCDAAYGNLETVILDLRRFTGAPYSWAGDWPLSSVPEVADDLALMHFSLVSRANNHALDWGLEGMRESGRRVAAAGLAQAGVGEDATSAAAPGYYASPKCGIALVSMVSTFRPTTNALPVSADAPRGRPGVNGLEVSETLLLDAASYEQVATLACRFAHSTPCPASPLPATIELFGARIRVANPGETPYSHVYEMAPEDLGRIIAGTRSAKPRARYVVASVHAHEPSSDEDPPATWEAPSAFLRVLAHRLIDNGADAFVTTGIHHVAGIELYRGKPIFYGLGNFFWSDIQLPLSADLYEADANQDFLRRSFEHPERATDGDLGLVMNANSSFATAGAKSLNRTFQGVLTRTVFDDATRTVREIRLYPIDLGYGEKLTRSGIPRRAGPAVANSVLDRIIGLSGNSGLTIRKVNDGAYLIGVATPK